MSRFSAASGSFLALVLLAVIVLAGGALAWGTGLVEFSYADLERLLAGYGSWAPVLVILLMVVHCFIPFPAEVLALCAGALFGTLLGTALIWLGAMAGASLSFGLARYLGRDAVARLLPRRYADKLDHWADNQGTFALLTARFVPVIAFNLVNYAAGLTRVGWWTFLWTTAVGILPLTVLMVWFGAQMRELTWPVLLIVSVIAIGTTWIGYRLLTRHQASGR